MKLRHLLGVLLLGTMLQIGAQDLATAYKIPYDSNPISACVFCADPTALVK